MSQDMQDKPTVIIIDDDEAVRNALSLLIKSIKLHAVTFPSAKVFLENYTSDNSVGCLILDIRMPEMTGLELQRELARRKITIPVIVLTGHGDVPMAVQAMKAGAIDFIQKPFRDQDLIDRIHEAISLDERNRALKYRVDGINAAREQLTGREHEVLNLVVSGSANKVIAAKLGIAERTVEVHRANVMRKMQAQSLAQLIHNISLVSDDNSKYPEND